ncbi:hypothetical protein ACOSQ2_013619 [Xanthoceras sorbifolium]
MSNQNLKDDGLSGVSDSSSSRGSRGRRANEPYLIAIVTATGVIDLDPEFDEPATRVIDNVTERTSVSEASSDKASTSGAMALMVGGGFLLWGLSLRTLPKPNERTNSANDDWVCFYELPFKQALRFSVSYLIFQLLALLNMDPSQLMPNS